MRKIISKQEKGRKTKRNQLIIGGMLILLMVFSTLGYALGGRGGDDETNTKITYNGIEFIKDNSGYWYFNVQEQQFITRNNPEEISDINFLSYLNLNDYSNKPLYFVGDIGDGSSEISRNLAERFVLRIQQACLDEEDCEGNFPIKNCSIDNIIIFKEILNNEIENDEPEENKTKNNKTKEKRMETMYQEENCVFIYAQYENQTKYADKFLFSLLGI